MAVNLVSLVMEVVTPELIGKIGSGLGMDRSGAQSAVGASVPALLAALAGLASKPDGAKKLSDAISQQDPDLLDALTKAIGGSGQQALVDRGSSLLSSLLGGSAVGALTSGLSKFAGTGQASTTSLLGMLAPAVMGTIGQQDPSNWLDGNSVAKFFASQKNQIAAAIPPGLASLLGGTGLLDSVAGSLRGAAGPKAATNVAGKATTYANEGARKAEDVGSSFNWTYLLIGVAVAALLLWYFLGQNAQRSADAVRTTPQPVTSAQSLTVGGVALNEQVTSIFDTVKTALQGVTDAASAKAALPKLQDATTNLDKVVGMAGQLSPDGKKILAGLVASGMPSLVSLFDKVLAVPGVGDVAKPAIDALRMKLEELAKA